MKNLNELITTIVLIAMVIFAIREFFEALFSNEINTSFFKRLTLLKNYTDDESE